MIEEIKNLRDRLNEEIAKITDKDNLETFRLAHLVKKGTIQGFFDQLKTVSGEMKPLIGKELNILRKFAEEEFNRLKEQFDSVEDDAGIDLSLPGRRRFTGRVHPLTETITDVVKLFTDMGFTVAEGPEIEDGFHNFDALNFPPDHPARDMQDTFFMESDNREIVLRTHTSPVQIRVMQSQKPPIRSIMPGRVYRNESIDRTHLAEFHQIEGLYIDRNVTLRELKGTMMLFAKKMYGDGLQYRFQPSFFPFTEPSAQLDISRDGKKWMEVAGCGMVHPNVLRAGGIDPEEYTGFAFGFGIERIAMLRAGLEDIRSLYENDVRILSRI